MSATHTTTTQRKEPFARLAERLAAAGVSTDRAHRLTSSKAPAESGWADGLHPITDVTPGSYGVVGGDGLVVVDDDADRKGVDLPAWVRDLPDDTFTVETPHGGTHRYFAVRGDVVTGHYEWGDVIASGAYVVGPGTRLTDCGHGCCTPESPGRYRLVRDVPLAAVDAAVFPEDDGEGDGSASEDDGHTRQSGTFGGNVGDRLDYGRENDDRLDELVAWAESNGDPATVGFPGDRSRAECALAAKVWYWFEGDDRAVRMVMNRLAPPRWREETKGYRQSVLDAVAIDDVFDAVAADGAGPSRPSRELVTATWWEVALADDALATADVAESVDYSPRQVQKALAALQDAGMAEYVRDGRRGVWTDCAPIDDEWVRESFNGLESAERWREAHRNRAE